MGGSTAVSSKCAKCGRPIGMQATYTDQPICPLCYAGFGTSPRSERIGIVGHLQELEGQVAVLRSAVAKIARYLEKNFGAELFNEETD